MKADMQTIPELEAAIEALLEKEKEDLQADVMTFHYYDEPYDRLILPIGLNLKEPRRFKSWLPSMDRIAGQIIKTGKPVIAVDAEHHPDTTGPFVYAESIKSTAGYPVISTADKKVGVLFANYRDKHVFSKKEIALLAESAMQIADTVDGWLVQAPNLRTELSELAGRRREAAALQEIADTVRNVLGSVAVAIWTPGRQGDELAVTAQSGLKEHITRDARLSLARVCSITNAFQSRNPAIGNVLEEKIFSDDQSKAMRLNAIWAYPILSLTRALGVFSVFPIEYDTPTPREETIIDAWLKQAAATIESHRNLLTLTILHAMGRRLTSTLADPQSLMRDIVINAARVMNAESVSLHQYNPARQEFHSYDKSITYGIEPYPSEEKPRKGGISEYIVQHGLVRVTDIDDVDPQFVRAPSVISAGVKSYLGIRLKADEDVVGVLFFNYNEKREFSPDDVTIATTFANYAATAIHNSRIHRESLQRAERLELVRQVAAAVSSATDVDEILQLAVDGLARVFDVKQSAVALYDDAGEFAVVRKEYLEPGRVSALGHMIPLRNNPQVDRIRETKKALIVDDIENDPIMAKTRDILVERQTSSIMVVPIVIDDEVVGTIGVDAVGQKRHFTQGEADLAQAIADQASAAMRNARLIQQVTVRAEALKSLHAVGTELTSLSGEAEDLSAVLHRIATRAHAVLGADLIELYQYNQSQDEFVLPPIRIGELYRPEVVKKAILEDDILYPVIYLDQPKYTIDVLKDEILTQEFEIDRKDRPDERFVVREKVKSSAAVPLSVGNEKVGIMFANFRTPQTFSGHKKELIELFASQAAIAIRNARQHQEIQNSLTERLNDIRALQDITEQMHQGDLKAVLNLIAERAVELTGAKHGGVWLVNKTRTALEFGGLATRERYEELPPHISLDEDSGSSFSKLVVLTRESHLSGDVRKDTNYRSWYSDTISELTVPIIYQERVIGTINVESPVQDRFSEEHQRLLEAMAGSAAVMVQNARLIERLEIVNRMGREMTSGIRLHEDEILKLIYQQASQLMDTDNMYIALYDDVNEMIRFPLMYVGGAKIDQPARKFGQEGMGKTEWIIHHNEPIFQATGKAVEEWYEQPGRQDFAGIPLGSWMGVPMQVGEKVLGVIATYHPVEENLYGKDDLDVLSAMARQAAIAIDNARLYYDVNQKLERRVDALASLNEIGKELTSGIRLKEEEIVESICNQAQKLTSAQDIYVALYNEDTGEIRFALAMERGRRVELKARKADMQKRGKTEEIIFTQQPILHKTQQEVKKWYKQPEHQEFYGTVALSWLGVPMMVGEKVLGVIAVYDIEKEYAYDEQDLQVFSSMASQAAIALDNATLYYDVNQKLERRVDALASLNKIGQELTSGLRLKEEEIVESIYNQAQRLTGAQDMSIALYDEDTNEVRFALATEEGKRVEYPSRKADMEKRGKTEEIIFTRKTILHQTKQEAEEWYDQPGHGEKSGLIPPSWLGVPMIVGEKVLGVIAVYDIEKEYAYDEFQLEVLSSMASQAAIALANATLYQELEGTNQQLEEKNIELYQANIQILQAKEREIFVALGEIAAGLIHKMSNTIGHVPTLVKRVKKAVDIKEADIIRKLDQIKDGVADALEYIGSMGKVLEMRTLTKSEADPGLLISDALRQTGEVLEQNSVKIEEAYDGLPVIHVNAPLIIEVFRNIIHNAAEAMPTGGLLKIRGIVESDRITIEFVDKGSGITEDNKKQLFQLGFSTKKEGKGIGLWFSQKIVEQHQGKIFVTSEENQGTTFLVTLPVGSLASSMTFPEPEVSNV